MFKELTNLGKNRNIQEAIGFYIAYLILLMIAAGILAAILGVAIGNNSFNFGVNVGAILAIVSCPIFSLFILKEKKLLGNFGFILLVLLSGVLAIFIGGLGGLIPVSYLTTLKKTESR